MTSEDLGFTAPLRNRYQIEISFTFEAARMICNSLKYMLVCVGGVGRGGLVVSPKFAEKFTFHCELDSSLIFFLIILGVISGHEILISIFVAVLMQSQIVILSSKSSQPTLSLLSICHDLVKSGFYGHQRNSVL
jgi:hypothetical protein